MDAFAFKRHRSNQSKDAIRAWMLKVVSESTDEGIPLLLRVVADGPVKHRIAFLREAAKAQLAVDENVCSMIFRFFCQQVQKQYGEDPIAKILDGLHVSTPETDAEFGKRVAESWEYESGSSEMAKRAMGLPSGTGGKGAPANLMTGQSE